jgi:hypothetical protein
LSDNNKLFGRMRAGGHGDVSTPGLHRCLLSGFRVRQQPVELQRGGPCLFSEFPGTRVASQDAFDDRKAFSDFVLFVYEAMSVSGGGGSAKSTGGSFVYSVR